MWVKPTLQKSLLKKWNFSLRISSVNLTKSAGNCGFGHIYRRNPRWKNTFFVQRKVWKSLTVFTEVLSHRYLAVINIASKTLIRLSFLIERNKSFKLKGELQIDFRTPCVIMTLVSRSTITNDVSKFRKVIKFGSSCIVICFSYIYLIIYGKTSFIN